MTNDSKGNEILSVMIAALYEESDLAVARQGIPSTEWDLLSIAADAVASYLTVGAEIDSLAKA